jgi:hypothetical protein
VTPVEAVARTARVCERWRLNNPESEAAINARLHASRVGVPPGPDEARPRERAVDSAYDGYLPRGLIEGQHERDDPILVARPDFPEVGESVLCGNW